MEKNLKAATVVIVFLFRFRNDSNENNVTTNALLFAVGRTRRER